VLDQRRGLLVIDREPALDGERVVVRAADQRRAVDVAEAVALGRVEGDVVLVAVGGADAPPAEPLDEQLVRHVDEHRQRPAVLERLVELVGLLNRAREAVEQELVLRIDRLPQQVHHDLVRDELAAVHVRLDLRAVRRGGAQQVPRREVRHVALGRERASLRSLARVGWAEYHQIAHGL